MILWPKWRISGCRLVGSDATANSRASLAAFDGELGVELGGDFWVSCSSSGSCVCTRLGPVHVLMVALEFMLSVSHTHTHTRTYTAHTHSTHKHKHTQTQTHKHKHTNTNTHKHTQTHTNTHKHKHTHTHTH